MKIFVRVKPNSKETKVEKIDENHFYVWVNELPIRGKVNEALIKTLSEYFSVPQINFKITHGHKSRQKIVSVNKE